MLMYECICANYFLSIICFYEMKDHFYIIKYKMFANNRNITDNNNMLFYKNIQIYCMNMNHVLNSQKFSSENTSSIMTTKILKFQFYCTFLIRYCADFPLIKQ